MDPITAAIVAALSKIGETAVGDAYGYLKKLILSKCGRGSDIDKAMEDLEKKPQSKGRQTTLQEEVEDAALRDDSAITDAAQALLELSPGSMDNSVVEQHAGQDAVSVHQAITGNNNVQTVTGNVVYTPKHTVKNTITPRPSDISEAQLYEIQQKIHELAGIDEDAGLGNTHGNWTNRFKATFKLNAVARLPADSVNDAMLWFRETIGRERNKLYGKNSPALKKRLHRTVHAKRELLEMSKPELYELAEQRLGKAISSVTDLGVQRLRKLDRILQTMLNK
jgi:hypothetical protein